MADPWPYHRLCWEPSTVEETSAPDVAAARDSGILLATHQSLPLWSLTPPSADDRRRLEDRETIGVVRESEILETFLAATSDPLLVAVVGKSGSGKSHLVRWVYAHLQDRPAFRVIYVPRQGTNLRSVLKRILTGLPGRESTELLQALESATADMTVEHASAVLLDQLANTVEFRPPPHDDPTIQMMRTELSGANENGNRTGGLPELLRLPEYRRHFLAPGGVIPTYINRTIGENDSPEEEYRRFKREDLRLSVAPRLNALGSNELRIFDLIEKNDEWASAAAELLNDALEEALTQVLGLTGRVSLAEVMTRSRELLLEEGLDLVILIEDFALLENRIDRQLLEALLVPANSPGEPPRCRLRTMFAITDDPFERLQETVRTRLSALYRAGTEFRGQAGVDLDAAIEFVSSYLNAARVGPERLTSEFERAAPDERESGAWIPNACDNCPLDVQARCHDPVDGFGTNGSASKEYGLYPYNRSAVERALASVLKGGWFDPRTVINRLVNDVLKLDAGGLENGSFPTPAFANRFPPTEDYRPLSAEVAADAGRHPDPPRRTTLLTFWGGRPDVLADVGTYIHDAFNLSRIGKALPVPEQDDGAEHGGTGTGAGPAPGKGVGGGRGPETTTPSPPPLPPPSPPPAPRDDPDLMAIDRWLGQEGTALPDDLRARLRPLLHELVLSRIGWNDELLSPKLAAVRQTEEVFSQFSFEILPNVGQRAKPTAVRFQLLPNADNAVLLKAVLRFNGQGGWDGPTAAGDFLRLQRQLDDWAATVLAAVRTFGVGVAPWNPVPAALESLILAAGVAGIPGAFSEDPATMIAAALHPVLPEVPPERAHEAWISLHTVATSSDREEVRRLLISWVQAAQGEGAALAIDLPQLTGIARRFRSTLKLSDVPPHGPHILRQWSTSLSGKLEYALQEQGRALTETALQLRPYHGLNLEGLVPLLREAGLAARDRGVFGERTQYERFTSYCDHLEEMDLAELALFADSSLVAAGDKPSRFLAATTLIPLLTRARQLLFLMKLAHDDLQRSIANAESNLRNAPDLDAARSALDEVLAGLQAGAGGPE